jgi:sulfopyruvate decarboxylase subunit alpha
MFFHLPSLFVYSIVDNLVYVIAACQWRRFLVDNRFCAYFSQFFRLKTMEPETINTIINTLKEERIDLVVTLPEEPTSPLTEQIRQDPYFSSITVAGEGHGISLCAGASLGGRRCVFVTGIAGLFVGTWSLAQMGVLYGIPVLIVASYRGDIGDRSGISGAQLFMFQQLGEPLLNALRIPYRIIAKKDDLQRQIHDAHFACREYGTPVVLLLTGEVLW